MICDLKEEKKIHQFFERNCLEEICISCESSNVEGYIQPEGKNGSFSVIVECLEKDCRKKFIFTWPKGRYYLIS